jgi:hypothetical protein
MVRADRELAYPVLMSHLLPAGAFGLLVVSLLAAFMSTVDTHFNWGSSYLVTDVALRRWPNLSPARQILVAPVNECREPPAGIAAIRGFRRPAESLCDFDLSRTFHRILPVP